VHKVLLIAHLMAIAIGTGMSFGNYVNLRRAAAETGERAAALAGLRRVIGRIAEAALQVGGHGDTHRLDDQACVFERLVAVDAPIPPPEDAGARATGSGEGGEAQAFQGAGRARVVGIGHHEHARPLVEEAEIREAVTRGGQCRALSARARSR
jgi:hypothetical protein